MLRIRAQLKLAATAALALALAGCAAPHSREGVQDGAGRDTVQLRDDAVACKARAQQAVDDYREHGRRPALISASGLGVGVAIVLAEARATDQVRSQAFQGCMRSAGWELQAQR